MTDDLVARITKQLQVEEGTRLLPYNDSKGILTIGTGRNLAQVGIRLDEATLMLSNDIRASIEFLSRYSWYNELCDVRRAAIIDMSFMGIDRLFHFVKMIHDLTMQDFVSAAAEVKNSEWYIDVKEIRGNRVAAMILTGAWPTDVGLPPVLAA